MSFGAGAGVVLASPLPFEGLDFTGGALCVAWGTGEPAGPARGLTCGVVEASLRCAGGFGAGRVGVGRPRSVISEVPLSTLAEVPVVTMSSSSSESSVSDRTSKLYIDTESNQMKQVSEPHF
jgi:hypothetical protein